MDWPTRITIAHPADRLLKQRPDRQGVFSDGGRLELWTHRLRIVMRFCYQRGFPDIFFDRASHSMMLFNEQPVGSCYEAIEAEAFRRAANTFAQEAALLRTSNQEMQGLVRLALAGHSKVQPAQ